jgi:hypothetical protein
MELIKPLPEQLIRNIEFKDKNLILNDGDPKLKYRRRTGEEKTAISYGQRKLLFGEIHFLNLFWNQNEIKNLVLVVAGAAPGIHYPLLEYLFPFIEKIHLYDPSPFKIPESDKIKLYNEYFTDDVAKFWSLEQEKNKNVFFISDIRTADYTKLDSLEENELQIMKDMDHQMHWYKLINPIQALLKFRLPYQEQGMPRFVNYLDGCLMKQIYAPVTSTETRLVPSPNSDKTYDCLQYEEQLFHFNVIVREKYRYINPFTNDMAPIDDKELTNDFESRAETEILKCYLTKKDTPSEQQYDMVKSLSRHITVELNKYKTCHDTLEYLRANPGIIKKRNGIPKRDDGQKNKKIINIKKPKQKSNSNRKVINVKPKGKTNIQNFKRPTK